MPKHLPSILAGAALMLASAAAPAGARPLTPAGAGNGLGVITAVSQTATTVTTACFFTGGDATGLVLAVPHDATLSTLAPAQIARDITLTTLTGVKVHYILLGAKAGYLALALHSPQADLRFSFKLGLFRFSAAESRLIASHAVRGVRTGIAFSGGPGQLATAKFQVDV